MSNYHGCKGEAMNLTPYHFSQKILSFTIDVIHKAVKPSHLKKLQIIQK